MIMLKYVAGIGNIILKATQQKMLSNSNAHSQNLFLHVNLSSFTNLATQVNSSKIVIYW